MTTLNYAGPLLTLPINGYFGNFVVREANGYRSREEIVLSQIAATPPARNVLEDGTVLGRRSSGALSVGAGAAQAWNVGNATMNTPTADAGAPVGKYVVRFNAPTIFVVRKPDGSVLGNGTTGVAFSAGTGVNFTITAGGTPMAAADEFHVTVTAAAGTGEYVPYDPDATDGAETAAAILLGRYDVSDADAKAAVVNADAEVQRAMLVFGAGVDAAEKNTAYSALAAQGIKFR
jgi:hypothetical protein